MLRIYFLQQWFNLSDPGVEEALYDSVGMRQFAGIDLRREPVPDETTVCKFHHLLEEHAIGGETLQTVNLYLESRGVKITRGTIVDATVIHAPSSTKNREQQRDPGDAPDTEGQTLVLRHESARGSGQQDEDDPLGGGNRGQRGRMLPELLHGEETKVWGDQAYSGQTAAMRAVAPAARNLTHKQYRYKDRIDEVERVKNRSKSRVRSKVEQVFAVMKLKFGFVKVRYRGLRKNANRLFPTCALVNLFLIRRKLLHQTAYGFAMHPSGPAAGRETEQLTPHNPARSIEFMHFL